MGAEHRASRSMARRGRIVARFVVGVTVACVSAAGCAGARDRGRDRHVVPASDAGVGVDGGVDASLPGVDGSVACGADEVRCASGCCPAAAGEEVVFDDDRVETAMIAVDASGTPHIVFTPYEGLQHAVRGEDGAFTIAAIPGAERARYATTAAGPDGSVHLLYIVDYELYWARWLGGTWSTEPVDPSAAASAYALTIDRAGQPHVAYQHERFDSGFRTDELHYAARSASGVWRTELVHAESWDVGWMPSIAVDSAGTVGIVYCEDICYTSPNIAIKEAGSSWTYNQLPEDIGRSQTTIFIDARDYVHLAWMENGMGTIMYAYLTEEGWAPVLLDPSYPNVGGRVQLMDGRDGDVHAFYGTGASRHAILAATATSWAVTPVELERTSDVGDVGAAVDASGAVHVAYAWRDLASGRGELRYMRIAP